LNELGNRNDPENKTQIKRTPQAIARNTPIPMADGSTKMKYMQMPAQQGEKVLRQLRREADQAVRANPALKNLSEAEITRRVSLMVRQAMRG
jgi:hypothetical protein